MKIRVFAHGDWMQCIEGLKRPEITPQGALLLQRSGSGECSVLAAGQWDCVEVDGGVFLEVSDADAKEGVH